MPDVPPELSADNLFTAARRVVRNIRADDENSGGLLSRATVQANEFLARHIESEEKRIRERHNERRAAEGR